MRRFDYYAGVLILASAMFFGQMMAARHGQADTAQAQTGTAKVPDVVRAHRFELVDADGGVRARIWVDKGRSTLTLGNASERSQTVIAQGKNDFTFGSTDSHGENAILIGSDAVNGSVVLLNGKQNHNVLISTDEKGKPSINFGSDGTVTTLPGTP
jgi:hypothetical protein